MRELVVYSPKRSKRSILVELEERSQADLLALLACGVQKLGARPVKALICRQDANFWHPTGPDPGLPFSRG